MSRASQSKRARKKNKKEAASDEPLDDIACNINGWCVRIDQDDRLQYRTVNARGKAASTTLWTTKLSKPRESTESTAEESQDPPNPGCSKYLVVGVAISPELRGDKAITSLATPKKADGHSETKAISVGVEMPDEKYLFTPPEDSDRPMVHLVVAPLQDGKSQVRMGVLLEPRDGLCTPYHIGQAEVFYFSEYRDNAKAVKKRSTVWNRRVAIAALAAGFDLEDDGTRDAEDNGGEQIA